MIKLSNERTVRECTADYEYTAGGETKTEQIRVRYFSWTIAELKQVRSGLEAKAKSDPDGIVWLSDRLAERLQSLPDITDSKGKPLAITTANLDKIDIQNLERIQKAIDEDVAPKAPPAK